MKLDLQDLIYVIGKKYNVDLEWSGSAILLKGTDIDDVPEGLVDDLNNILLPLFEHIKSDKVLETKQELLDLIPKHYFDEIQFIDEDGAKVLSMSELKKAVESSTRYTLGVNTNENVAYHRKNLKSAYVLEDFPVMKGLEEAWRVLEKHYEGVINRERQVAEDPISALKFYLEMGFYPPPEILLLLLDALQMYFGSKGEFSLDEILFGEKYKKTSSQSYKKHKEYRYKFFEMSLKLSPLTEKAELEGKSVEARMLKILENTPPATLEYFGFDPDIEIDTFMRGYRRWKKDNKDKKE